MGVPTTYADNTVVLNNCSNNSELRGHWTIDGDMTIGSAHKISLRHSTSDAVLRLEATNTIDSFINGTKYLQLDDTEVSSFSGLNLSSDKRLKDNVEGWSTFGDCRFPNPRQCVALWSLWQPYFITNAHLEKFCVAFR